MTTWKDNGSPYGKMYREIISTVGNHYICEVLVALPANLDPGSRMDADGVVPWPEGKANFRLILNAPKTLEALEAIRDKVECYLQPDSGPSVSRARWESVRKLAVNAIAAAKGENSEETELV